MEKIKRIMSGSQYKLFPEFMEHPDPVSETVPGEAMGIEEMFRRSQQGLGLSGRTDGEYDEGDGDIDAVDLEKFGQMDLFDREELIEVVDNLRLKVEDYEKKLKSEIEAKKSKTSEDEKAKPSKKVVAKVAKPSKKSEDASDERSQDGAVEDDLEGD